MIFVVPQITVILLPETFWKVLATLLFIAIFLLIASFALPVQEKTYPLTFQPVNLDDPITIKHAYQRNTHDYLGATSLFRIFSTTISNFRANSLRSFIIMQTFIAIFAVDFSIFPARFIKTENLGTSLMDVGVGCYIFMNAYTMIYRRHCAKGHLGILDNGSRSFTQKFSHLMTVFYKTLPLIFLGLGRLLTLKGVNYHEHVSEYGLHWNFFLTLLGLSWITSTLQTFIPPPFLVLIDILIIGFYQLLLSKHGLQDYIFSDVRDTLIDQNKEGIFSLAGYTFIHLTGYLILANFAKYVLQTKMSFRAFLKLLTVTIFWWLLYFFATDHCGLLTSRRSANLPFGLWIISFCLTHLTSYLPVELILGPQPVLLFRGISRNPLVAFLFANILTGLANLTFQTLLVDRALSFMIVIVYSFIVCLFCYILDECLDLSLK